MIKTEINNTSAKWVWGLFVAGTLFMIGRYMWKQINYLYNACYTVSGGAIRKVSLNEVKLTLLFKVMNRSDIPLTLERQFYEVFFDGTKVATVSKTGKVEIGANSVVTFPIDVSFSPKELVSQGLKNVYNIISDKSKVKVVTKGKLDFSSGILAVKQYPFEYSMTLEDITKPSDVSSEYTCPDKF